MAITDRLLHGGLIGLGRMGITHLAILGTHPQVRIAAACDTSSFVLRQFQRFMPIAIYDSWEQLIDQQKLDFVVISTPTSTHASAARYAIAHGIHVFMEKPFTLNINEGIALVSTAQQAGLANQVGYVNRFNAVFRQVKGLIETSLGEILHFSCSMHAPTVLREPAGGWRNRRREGGGCLYDFGCHGIDLIHFLIGVPDRVGGTAFRRIFSTEAEDAVYATFIYSRGFIGHLSVNWSDESCRKPAYRFEVEGINGRLTADQHGYKLYLRRALPGSRAPAGWSVCHATDLIGSTRFYVRGNEFTDQLDYFVGRILGDHTGTINSFNSGLEVDRTVQAIVDECSRAGAA